MTPFSTDLVSMQPTLSLIYPVSGFSPVQPLRMSSQAWSSPLQLASVLRARIPALGGAGALLSFSGALGFGARSGRAASLPGQWSKAPGCDGGVTPLRDWNAGRGSCRSCRHHTSSCHQRANTPFFLSPRVYTVGKPHRVPTRRSVTHARIASSPASTQSCPGCMGSGQTDWTDWCLERALAFDHWLRGESGAEGRQLCSQPPTSAPHLCVLT